MTAPRFSIVLHLPDARGIDAESVRSWVAQDFARERFEVVAVTDGGDRAVERRIPPLLGAPDSLLRFPRATRAELFDRGARAARGEFLVFTESHCVAEPAFLSAMDRFLSDSGAPAAFGPLAALDAGALSRLDGRCNLDGFAIYHAPDDWRKLNVHSCALRRTEYLAAGGFRTRYGIFSELLLADELWRRGVRPAPADVPAVAHLFSGSPTDALTYQRDVVAGELRYHREHPRGPHIGHTFLADGDPPWAERDLERAALRALWGERRRLGTGRAARQAWRVLKLAAREGRAGRLFDHLKIHLAAGACRLIGSRPAVARRLFLGMWATAARLARKEYFVTELPHECRAPRAVEFAIDELPARDLWGFHLPERWNGLPVRWTEPCAVVRLPRPVGPCEVELLTHGVGWSLEGRGLAVYADGRRVADSDVLVEWDRVRVRLPALEGAGPLVLATVCAPPAGDDPRALGFPLFGVTLRAGAAQARAAA